MCFGKISLDIDMFRYVEFGQTGGKKMGSYSDYATTLKVLGEETRLKIIDMLSCGEMCACDILEKLNISQSTLSYHMNLLNKSELVNARKEGLWMRYTLNAEKFNDLKSFIEIIINE